MFQRYAPPPERTAELTVVSSMSFIRDYPSDILIISEITPYVNLFSNKFLKILAHNFVFTSYKWSNSGQWPLAKKKTLRTNVHSAFAVIPKFCQISIFLSRGEEKIKKRFSQRRRGAEGREGRGRGIGDRRSGKGVS